VRLRGSEGDCKRSARAPGIPSPVPRMRLRPRECRPPSVPQLSSDFREIHTQHDTRQTVFQFKM
jgi:hypothetical protein